MPVTLYASNPCRRTLATCEGEQAAHREHPPPGAAVGLRGRARSGCSLCMHVSLPRCADDDGIHACWATPLLRGLPCPIMKRLAKTDLPFNAVYLKIAPKKSQVNLLEADLRARSCDFSHFRNVPKTVLFDISDILR